MSRPVPRRSRSISPGWMGSLGEYFGNSLAFSGRKLGARRLFDRKEHTSSRNTIEDRLSAQARDSWQSASVGEALPFFFFSTLPHILHSPISFHICFPEDESRLDS